MTTFTNEVRGKCCVRMLAILDYYATAHDLWKDPIPLITKISELYLSSEDYEDLNFNIRILVVEQGARKPNKKIDRNSTIAEVLEAGCPSKGCA